MTSFSMAGSPTPGRSVRRKAMFAVIATLVVGFVAFSAVAGFLTDRMWFGSLDQTRVFDTLLITKIVLWLVGAVVGAVFMFVNLLIAYRSRSPFAQGLNVPGIENPNAIFDVVRRIALIGLPIFAALVMGSSVSSQWSLWIPFMHVHDFGTTDVTFGKDISFFVMKLPVYEAVQASLSSLVFMTFIVSGVMHYVIGGFRPVTRPDTGRLSFEISDVARRQAAVLIGVYLMLNAVGQYFGRFNLALNDGSLITGLNYVDANVHLPAQTILAGISLVCALLFLANAFIRNLTLPVLGVALMLLSSILLGGIWPGFVQQVQVKPDEQAKESPYIARNIAATRTAYGLDDVEYTTYNASETPDPAKLKKDAATLSNIRLLDPYVVASTFEQLQQLKGFYSFAPVLDVARYRLAGQVRGTLLAVREVNLDGIPESQRNWVTNHLIYTHGIGLAAAYDNAATTDGQPQFIESDVPPKGLLEVSEPRIYFGENSPDYSIVGGASGIELDYPDDKNASGQQNTTYTGKGGVAIGSFANKLLFAAVFGEPNILLSEQVTANSRILYKRDPRERVKALAPWLNLDGDPYPAVVNGRIVWIVDGYTASSRYPYSQYTSLGDAVLDSSGHSSDITGRINYLRNSVKATVDAYDGNVTLYAWDDKDPILKSWSAAFPNLVQPKSAMSAALLSQIRYPEDLFKIQRNILRKYHINDPAAFFTGENFWIIPNDPTSASGSLPQPPYYLNLQMPGDDTTSFSVTSTFAPAKRPSLAAFMAVNSDSGPNYGRIRVLQLPSQTTIPGPVQAQNIFESDAAISTALSLLRKGGSDTVQGNLLSLPVAGGILYVEPIYVKSTGAGGYPLLRKVMVSFGQKAVLADTLSGALNQVFGGSSVPDNPDVPTPPNQTLQQKLTAALLAAQKAYDDGQTALKSSDFAAYGDAQKRLAQAIARAKAAADALAKAKP